MLWRRWGVFRFDMVMISFVSKDNEGNQNLLVKDRQAGRAKFLQKSPIKCGSWLACDSGLSVTEVQTDTPLSQASQLPQGMLALARRAVDNSALLDFDRALPTVDVALAGTGYSQLGLIHILIDS